MSANAVIDGSFAELKFVKSRSVVQMIVELPIERAEEAIQKFGVPLPGQEIPVALARLVVPAEGEAPREARVEQDSATGTNDTKSPARSAASKLSHAMKDKPSQAASTAGMMRSDARYRMYLKSLGWVADTEEQVAHAQRAEIEVKSCSEISLGGAAYERFQAHELAYKQWAGLAAEMR